MIEPDLTALGLQQAVSFWKIVLVTLLFITSLLFADSIGLWTGANVETLKLAGKNLSE